jgi:hypothetical protein
VGSTAVTSPRVSSLAVRRVNHLALDYPANLSKLNDAQAKAAGQKTWDRHMKNYELAVKESMKGNVRTIVIDTATELAEILAISKDGRVDQKKDDYGRTKGFVKLEMAKMIKMSREGNANLILLARAKEVWEGGQPTGTFKYQGPDTFEYDADFAGHLRLERRRSVKMKQSLKHELQITKAGVDLEQLGEVYGEDDWGEMGPFVYACVMNFPGTSPDDWT